MKGSSGLRCWTAMRPHIHHPHQLLGWGQEGARTHKAAEGLGHKVLETPGWEAGAATQALEPWPLCCCEPLPSCRYQGRPHGPSAQGQVQPHPDLSQPPSLPVILEEEAFTAPRPMLDRLPHSCPDSASRRRAVLTHLPARAPGGPASSICSGTGIGPAPGRSRRLPPAAPHIPGLA